MKTRLCVVGGGAERRAWDASSDEGMRTTSLVGGMSNLVCVRALVESGDNVVTVTALSLARALSPTLSLFPFLGHVRALPEPTLV